MHRDGVGAAAGSHGHERRQQVAFAGPAPGYQADRAGDPSGRVVYYRSLLFLGEVVGDGARYGMLTEVPVAELGQGVGVDDGGNSCVFGMMENRRVVRRVGPGRNRLVVLDGIEAKSHGRTDRPSSLVF